MAAGDLITTDYQYEWNETVLFGDATDIDVDEIDGLDDLPGVTTGDTPRDTAWGSVAGHDQARDRAVTISGEFVADTDTDLAATLDSLRDEFAISDAVRAFVWQHPGEEKRLIWARCRRRSIPTTLRRALRFPVWGVQLVAVDPLIYSAAEHTASTVRTAEGTGFTAPFTAPFTLGASTAGVARASNGGSVAAPWTGRLDGPLTNPVITNLSTGDRLAFTANGGLTLAAGEYVDIASAGREVLLAGTASRRSQLSLDSRWWDLPPGDTDLELAADAGTGTFTVTWRDTWI
jgi:hypothetical protein